ncbi:gluconate 2-dehydrogenase subunit 3 family protein [Dyadobacter subterraneus]|uniref:Gluconate 2-dehydrogenase subunit 3 family protein n=1 Tax=Dyadobacter subterraneus TaxID=2773304 RepID=A0ABR9WB14_9BACT|nr:gluconate 2-dehydrogenase subunit 3 family protein [Dyadobacter subterraneus]MBE9462650.1 gluconate 2-dehydrogenase subunit 3 family protein [Dyadobacter subterraneus]
MENTNYPDGWVKEILETEFVKPSTRALLLDRLDTNTKSTPDFFDDESFSILQCVCMRLIPQDRNEPIDLAGLLDEQLSKSPGNGWRYDELPEDKVLFKKGIKGMEKLAQMAFAKTFCDLDDAETDQILLTIQAGNAKGYEWDQIPSNLFFEELLASLVELYYSHPLAKEEIGDISFADAKGWKNIGLDQIEKPNPNNR